MPTFRPFFGRAKRGPTDAPVARAGGRGRASGRASQACAFPHTFKKRGSRNNSIVSAMGHETRRRTK